MTGDASSLRTAVEQALGRPDAIWIVLSNAIPIVGVLFWGWSAFSLLLFYWIENVVLGGFNALKIAICGLTKPKILAILTLFLVPFFVFHYGLFCFVHGVFVLAMFTFAGGAPESASATDIVAVVLRELETDADLRQSVIMLIGVQAGSFAVLWVAAGNWRTTNPLTQMFEPYSRIFVLHVTIFVATIPVLLLAQTWIAVGALAIMKVALELGLPQWTSGLEKLKTLPPDRLPE